jgi:hypothetical protein
MCCITSSNVPMVRKSAAADSVGTKQSMLLTALGQNRALS